MLDGGRPHVAREAGAVGFPPTVVAGFDGVLDEVVKIVAVSDDAEALGHLETEIGELRLRRGLCLSFPELLP